MTQRIYYTDSYSQKFSSRVEQRFRYKGRPAVTLSETLFYPESGGQPSDRGRLGGIPVMEVVEDEDEIVHLLERDGLAERQLVEGSIDWERRFDHMQQHTGQHILSQAFLQKLDSSTVSFHLGASSSTIDLEVEGLSKRDLYGVEDLANQIIFENREVKIRFLPAEEQENLPIRKATKREGEIRVIEIEEFDYSPCGGTHCRRTGEVGLIKIRRWERIKKRARLEFFCGRRALLDYRWKNRAVYKLSKEFSVADRKVLEAIERLKLSEKESRQEVNRLQEEILDFHAKELVGEAVARDSFRLVKGLLEDLGPRELNALASKILALCGSVVILLGSRGEKPFLLFARSPKLEEIDLRDLIKIVTPLIDGGGGGSPDRVQAGGARVEGLVDALERAETRLLEPNRN